VPSARLRLVSLGVSQTARALADWCLRVAAVVALVVRGGNEPASAWYLATVAFITPFIVLAPLNGYLSNSLPRRRVLVGAATFIIVVLLPFAFVPPVGGQWVWLLLLTAFAAAVYQPARYAMLPAAADDAHSTLPRVNGWMEMGSSAAILGGILLGWYFGAPDADHALPDLQPELIAALLGLNGLCLATAFFAWFPSDQVRPEAVSQAVAGFFRDVARIGRERDAGASLLGLASFQALVMAGSGVLLAGSIARGLEQGGDLLRALLLVGGGAVGGCALAGWQAHPARNLGLVPFGAVGLVLALIWGGLDLGRETGLPAVPAFLLGFTGALVNVPLRSAYLAAVPADARGNATAVMNTAIYVLTSLLALLMYALTRAGVLPTALWQFGLLALLALVGTALAVRFLFREMVENVVECLVWPVYRIRAHGPGADRIPRRGPLLIVANHTTYADPFWVGKITPRSIVPMMTSVFYDLPFIHWWMARVVHAIRVEATTFRREAPELRAAIERLREGRCLVIFPEARLRASADVLLRPFGQGVWHILREVPETVVVPLWIEGGWGSWTSRFRGPPMKNKRFDWWRRIDIGVGAPAPLAPELLKDHRSTRAYLHAACLACRQYVGLQPGVADGKEDDAAPVEKQV
jgi:1-acyl-sn-glycerol-3-phosphate acyltransferase